MASSPSASGATRREVRTAPREKPPPAAPLIDLEAYVLNFVSRIPRKGSEGYQVPLPEQAATMAAAYRAVVAGNVRKARRLLDPLQYDVARYVDTGTGRPFIVMFEIQNNDGSWPHAWGLYIRAPKATSHLTVEVAHPLADRNTEPVGVATFRDADASNLFVAGAHRYANQDGSADVTRNVNSVFEAVHRTALLQGAAVFQPHGFSANQHPNDGQVVVSSGVAPPQELAVHVANDMEAQGFAACLYDAVHCTDLGGTDNVQGMSAREAGATFLHVEMSAEIRDDVTLRNELAGLIAGDAR
jgi:hypothetical protein